MDLAYNIVLLLHSLVISYVKQDQYLYLATKVRYIFNQVDLLRYY